MSVTKFIDVNILAVEQQSLNAKIRLVSFTDQTVCPHNYKMHIGGVSCDLAKALYCYNMIQIQPSRIQDKRGQWLKSYLPDKSKNQKSNYEIQICTINSTSVHTPFIVQECQTYRRINTIQYNTNMKMYRLHSCSIRILYYKEYIYSNVFGWQITLSYVHYLHNFSWK